jgi:hypothetical protein
VKISIHNSVRTWMFITSYILTFSGDEVSGDERWPVSAIHYQGDTL